jgi:hypothetical protein
MYLHAAGAIGAQGPGSDFQMLLPAALQNYRVCPPAYADARAKAVRSSLRFLSVAPDWITFPLLAAVYRAPLGGVDFSLFLTGRTGTFKTALATLCQQHFGAAMDVGHLPANFASTANALEELAFCAKDALMVVDDFVLIGGAGDGMLQGIAERLFRAAGAGEVDRAALSRCQAAGQDGSLAAAMGAYLAWMAGRYEERQQNLQTRVRELRCLVRERSNPVQ